MKIKLDDWTEEYIAAIKGLSDEAAQDEPFYAPQMVREVLSVLLEAKKEITLLRERTQAAELYGQTHGKRS